MNSLHLRRAKAEFSAVIEAAERGEPTVITKHGHPAAMIVPYAQGQSLYRQPSFAALLMAIPYPVDADRDPTPIRDCDL